MFSLQIRHDMSHIQKTNAEGHFKRHKAIGLQTVSPLVNSTPTPCLKSCQAQDCTSLCPSKQLSPTCHVSLFAAPDTDHKQKFSLTHFIHFSYLSDGLTFASKPCDPRPHLYPAMFHSRVAGSTQIPSLTAYAMKHDHISPREHAWLKSCKARACTFLCHVLFLAALDTDHKHKFSLTCLIYFSYLSESLTSTQDL